jgi:hypothetical protein
MANGGVVPPAGGGVVPPAGGGVVPPAGGGVVPLVNLNDIERTLNIAGPGGAVRPPPPTYEVQAAVYLAWFFAVAIIVLTLIMIFDWMWHSPASLSNADLKGTATNLAENADVARKLIDSHKVLSDASTDRSVKLFDSFIGKALLPVFTTLIGYIIGSRRSGTAEAS